MRDYELTVLMRPNLEEKELDKEIKNLQELISKNGAKIKSKKDAEKKALSYPIEDNSQAYYLYFELTSEPNGVVGLEQKLKLLENVIRYLLVTKASFRAKSRDL